MVYRCNGILLSKTKEQISDRYDNVDVLQKVLDKYGKKTQESTCFIFPFSSNSLKANLICNDRKHSIFSRGWSRENTDYTFSKLIKVYT